MASTYKLGTFVTHPNKPEWGLGKVISSDAGTVTVVFKNDPDRGFRRINASYVSLTPIKGASDPVLDCLPSLDAFERGWNLDKPNYAPLWRQIARHFGELTGGRYRLQLNDSPFSKYLQLYVPQFGTDIHYEWLLRTADSQLDVALHAELCNRAVSMKWLEPMFAQSPKIGEGVQYELVCGEFGELSGQVTFVIPYEFAAGTEAGIALIAAGVMKTLVERTIDLCPRPTQLSGETEFKLG